MATLATTHPTLLDLALASGTDDRIMAVIEILNQTNEILEDMVWREGNLATGHQTAIRTGLPAPTWRKLYGGVQPTKGQTAKIVETTGMLEAYAEVDKALADLANNTAMFRALEDRAHIEGMNIEMADTLFHGNEATEPEAFTGFGPRYNSLSAGNAENILDAGGTGTDNTSIWLVGWGPNTVFGIIPKGSQSGLQMRDLGEVTLETAPGTGSGRMQAYRTHYRWDAGLCVQDWRYVVRIANIDKSDLTWTGETGADLINLMTRAEEMLPSLGNVRPVYYVSRTIKQYLRTQMVAAVKNSTLSVDMLAGRAVMSFDGIPVRRVDQLAADEARIT